MAKRPKSTKVKRSAYANEHDYNRALWSKHMQKNTQESFNAYIKATRPRKTSKEKRLEKRANGRNDKAQYLLFVTTHPGFGRVYH